jgi:hypothetical protein
LNATIEIRINVVSNKMNVLFCFWLLPLLLLLLLLLLELVPVSKKSEKAARLNIEYRKRVSYPKSHKTEGV